MSENEIDTMFKQEKIPSDNSNNSSVVSSIILSALANETVVSHANGLSDSDDNKEDDELFNRYVQKIIIQFIYSEKAAKFCEIFTLLLTGT